MARVITLLALSLAPAAGRQEPRSHPADRPLPAPSRRPLASGPTYFADSSRGDDANDGSEAKPWRTLARAQKALRAGDTLCLRGGTFYEAVGWTASGTAENPVTLRSHPGELAIIDGGFREFFEAPADAWEPAPGGAEGEFRSRKAHPGLERALGNFGDSWLPLCPYLCLIDLEFPFPCRRN